MMLIRDLDDIGNVVVPSTARESIETWRYCMNNVGRANETVDYKLFKIRIFGS